MSSEENFEEYGRNVRNDSDIIQNALSKRDSHLRRVSFPENDTDLVTGYLEPVDPLRLAINVDKEELLKAYEVSCHRHNTVPIQNVVEQVKKFKIDNDRTESFTLNHMVLTHCGCESLEEIFKRVQFDHINLTDCGLTSETAFALFEMFEYYESTTQLNISSNGNLGIRGWQACSRYIKKSNTLEELIARDIQLAENEADYLTKPLAFNRHLQVLVLENCNLNGSSLRYLANALTNNMTLKELYLADNKLGLMEATHLGTLLKNNRTLQVLDLSNNQIRDTGINHLVLGLCSPKLGGLEVLILWNNLLTSACSSFIEDLLKGYRGLSILNIGCNNINDSFIVEIKESLKQNQNLQRLGLQSTKLTCKSAIELSDVLRTNTTIERIDLRENCILIPGLRALLECLECNKNVLQIDLNEIPSWNESSSEYQDLVKEINSKCASNTAKPPTEDQNRLSAPRGNSRKISLTCQTLTHEPFVVTPFLSEPKKFSGKLRSPAPSPIPSPVSSPVPTITKSRFSVSRVSESEAGAQISRFTVCTVAEPPKAVVTSNSGSVTIGFNCTTAPSKNQQNETIKQDFTTTASSVERAPINPETNKPLTSIEKLLSLFQAPLFTRSSAEKQKSVQKYPFTNTNGSGSNNKNTNIPATTATPTTESYTQSIKENISPEHSLTLANTKRLKSEEMEVISAFEVVRNGSKENADPDIGRVTLCSSSEDSDSGLMAFESSCSSNSVTDSGVSDDSVASYDCAQDKILTDSVDQPQSDLTNNNRWKTTGSAAPASATINETLDRNDR